ncbi:hypothetical protein FBU30_006190 [Linnemannia zychae]|nr:hypothetical protein FBU30_006190 [Linnemannia zychae]
MRRQLLHAASYSVLIALLLNPYPSFAQTPFIPIPVRCSATAKTSTRFYVLSGDAAESGNPQSIPQFMYLDLSVSWPGTRPVWYRLTGGPQQYLFPAAMSSDEQTLIAFQLSPTFAMRYNVKNDSWSSSQIKPQYGGMEGIGAVTDPTTGLVYLAGGFTGNRDAMTVYDFKPDTMITAFPLPAQNVAFESRAYYANVWSKYRKTAFYFGGYNASLERIPTNNVLTEFDPVTNLMSTVATVGPSPPMRADHCMASNDDGTLIVIYGGRFRGPMYANDIYVYNVITRTWKAGPPGLFRVYPACTISGNQLIVWGGINEFSKLVTDNIVLIFNIDTMSWTNHFVSPLDSSRQPQPPDGTETNIPKSKKTSISVVIGATIGGLAVIAILALIGYFIWKRGKRPLGAELLSSRDDDDVDHKRGGSQSNEMNENDEELQQLRVRLQTQQEELELHRRLMQVQQEQQQIQQLQIQQQQYHLQQQQQQQQRAMQHHQSTQFYPFTNVNSAYLQDNKAPYTPPAGPSTSATNPYNSQSFSISSSSTPNSPIYAAYPYNPLMGIQSPTQSHSIITNNVDISTISPATTSRANSVSTYNHTNNEDNTDNHDIQERGYSSGMPTNPQYGARER